MRKDYVVMYQKGNMFSYAEKDEDRDPKTYELADAIAAADRLGGKKKGYVVYDLVEGCPADPKQEPFTFSLAGVRLSCKEIR